MRRISRACVCLAPFAVAVILALLPRTAGAVDLYINGENVTGIRNLNLVNARIRIDEHGNVYVDAPGYTVRRMEGATARDANPAPAPAANRPAGGGGAAPALPPLSKRYYIVTSETGPTQYDLEIFVNGTSVARVRHDGEPVIDLLNRWLRPGRNEIRIVAHKNIGDERRASQSRNHVHRVLIGEGTEQQGQVNLDVTLVDYSVNASQTDDMTSVFTITAR